MNSGQKLESSSEEGPRSWWWFAPMPPQRLAGVRIACGVYTLWYLIPRQDVFSELWRTDPNLYAPVGIAQWLSGPIAPGVMDFLYWATIALGLCFTAGWKHRISGPLFSGLLLLLLCYRNSWSMIFHMHNALVLHALILGWTRSADVWSVDRLLSLRRGLAERTQSCRYGWPVMLISAVMISSYFLSGVAKVAGPDGLSWASGQSLRDQVAVNAIRYEVLYGDSASIFKLIYEHTWVFWLMGIGTFVLELGAPLALANRRLGMLWALMTFGLHWGIFFVMGIKFRYQLTGLAFASFFDLEKLPAILGRQFQRLAPKPNLSEATVRDTAKGVEIGASVINETFSRPNTSDVTN